MHLDRMMPRSFRSVLPQTVGAPPSTLELRSSCRCGRCSFAAPAPAFADAIRCHCVACRKFHTSAFAAYVVLAATPDFGASVTTIAGRCAILGDVERVVCSACSSKLATRPLTGEDAGTTLLALGCVEDESVPAATARRWQRTFDEWSIATAARWWTAVAERRGGGETRVLRGGCSCGSCRFEAPSGDEFQTQHCYCRLCRQCSGAASQTWVPVRALRWTARDHLKLVRTTGHGQRHMCSRCHGVMSIIYDSQPDCAWPVAGALDDDSIPDDLGAALSRSIHICCGSLQPWYELPDDDLPRLRYAG